jgi:hypothetical protein
MLSALEVLCGTLGMALQFSHALVSTLVGIPLVQ